MTVPMSDPRYLEYILRIWKLMESPRNMTLEAARTVVDAAMYGIGCVEGEMRAKIEREKK